MRDLSIIIVSLNIKDLLKECLESVYEKEKRANIEIFVVDNASDDGTPEMVEKEFPQVKIIRNKKNIGFGPANNMGMRRANGRYVLLLNPDTKIITKNIFSEMVAWMDKHPKVGISSCALLNPDLTYQGSGGYSPTIFRVLAWMTFLDDIPVLDRVIKPYHPLHIWSPFYKGEEYFARPHEQDWVTGAFFMMRRKAMEDVGFFDEDYFTYVEEVDYSYRTKKKGWKIWYLPRWRIVHYGQVTTGSERAMINEFEGLKLFYRKHKPGWQTPILRFFLKLGAAARIVIFGILKGPNVAKTYVKAFKVA